MTTSFAAREHRLTQGEKKRNQIGTSLIFAYTDDQETVYPSSLPGFFPPITHCQCKMGPFNLPTLDGLHLVKGLCDGVQLGIHAMPGFPTLQALPHTTQVLHHSVNVFQADSRNQSVVLFVRNTWEGKKTADIAEQLIGSRIFGNWPFLVEGMVVAVSDSHFKYEKTLVGGVEKVISNPHTTGPRDGGMGGWTRRAERIENWYSKRFGVVTGDVDVLVHTRPLKGVLEAFSCPGSRLTLSYRSQAPGQRCSRKGLRGTREGDRNGRPTKLARGFGGGPALPGTNAAAHFGRIPRRYQSLLPR